jgi:hypothetical protein
MGREATVTVTWRGVTGPGRVLLESDALILRGANGGRIARDALAGWHVAGDALVMTTPDGPLSLRLGADQAAAWVRALDKPVPTLAAKMGLAAGAVASGPVNDTDLAAALAAHLVPDDKAALVVAEVRGPADLDAAVAMAGDRPLWVVTVKGPAAPYSDNTARAALRARGWIDSKSCAVSATMTATRYAPRKG